MSASYDKVTGLPTFYKYVPTEPPQDIIPLNYDIMNEIGKAVKLRDIEINQRNKHNLLMNDMYFKGTEDWYGEYYDVRVEDCNDMDDNELIPGIYQNFDIEWILQQQDDEYWYSMLHENLDLCYGRG